MEELLEVVIVDDHPIFRRGLRAILEEPGQPSVRLVGEANDAVGALALVEEAVPDILIADLKLGDFEAGLALIRGARQLSPHTRVLVLTGFDEADHLVSALRAGADGCVSKADRVGGDELRAALGRLAAGEPYWSPLVFRRLHDLLHRGLERGEPPAEALTRREREVLALVADGATNQEIAARLSISLKTVKTHVSNLLSKLQLQSRYEAAIYYRARQRPG